MVALEQNRIACAPVLSVEDTLAHPYFKARQMVRAVTDPILGEVTILSFPLKFSVYPDLPDLQAPLLGQHSVQVLQGYLVPFQTGSLSSIQPERAFPLIAVLTAI